MLLIVKPLAKPEKTLQIFDTATVGDLQLEVNVAFGIPIDCQRLLFKGCPLLDKNKKLMDYKLDNGDRITLVVKTIAPPRSNFETLLREYLVKTYTEEQTEVILPAFMEVLSTRLNSMSLNDIERLAKIWLQTYAD
ncbi:Ubiquitin [Fasciolopsis buskii]|uniref:Ubiquitin n=1 Tax=Fasciolopsis buskii TaxID=27845 RepID=A0A8E0RLN2_9TREM|nr:Ubiquitin [Fasciolopsis buski]